MNAQPTIQHISLDALRLSPRNARKTGGEDIDDLVASIEAEGILQNLVVTAANDGMFDVEAGGRRLRALQLLREQGRLRAGLELVPCRIVADDVAGEASLAENTVREAMHPADQFDAFKRLVDDGKSFEEVAARFGVDPVVVKRRLKLANVHPDLFQIYREDEMDLDQLQALALTDNHEMQRQAWFSAKYEYERHPRHLREFITREKVKADSALAQFVGIEAYEAAGGKILRDLFGDDAWLSDRALLDRLAMDRLEAEAETLRAQGWAWVEPHLALDYATLNEYPTALKFNEAEETWASAADAARAAELEPRIRELENREEESDGDDDEYQRLMSEYEDIFDRRVMQVPEEIRNVSGVLLTVGGSGAIKIESARLKPGQKLDRKSGAIAGGKPKAEPAASKPQKPQLSFDMVARLNLHRSAACRRLLIDQPALALQLLTANLVGQLIDRNSGLFDVTIKNVHRNTQIDKFPDLAKAQARAELNDLFKATIPSMKAADTLPWVQKLTAEQLQKVHALVAAVSLDNLTARELGPLADQLGLNMANWWEADGPRYLSNVPKALILEAVSEARGKDAAAKIANMKKDAIVAEAGKLLAGTGWLPKPLRGANYALKGTDKARTPAPKAQPSKKMAAKKSSSAAQKQPATKKVAKKPTKASKKAPAKKAAKKS